MEKAKDNIQVGVAIFVYNNLLRGWISPDGQLYRNPIRAEREAEALNKLLTAR